MHRTPFRNLVPAPPALHLLEQRPLLLVVDVQAFAADPAVGLGALAAERGVEDELAEYYAQVGYARKNVAELLAAFRGRGLPVAYTRRAAAATPGAWQPPWVAGPEEPAARIVPELAPRPEEPVLTRREENPFAGGGLDRLLAAGRCETVVVTGLFLPGAVDLAVREAAGRGVAVVLVTDACAAETYALHECLTTQLVGGPVRLRTTGALVSALAGRPP